jgi:hypothetical protein
MSPLSAEIAASYRESDSPVSDELLPGGSWPILAQIAGREQLQRRHPGPPRDRLAVLVSGLLLLARLL